MTVWLAEAHLRAGARERAHGLLEPALDVASELGYRHLEGVAHRLMAEALGDRGQITAHLTRAIALLGEVGAESELAKTHEHVAIHEHTSGDSTKAEGGCD